MKTWLILLCAFSALLWSFAAPAQETIDAAKITCNQFMFGRIADSRTISIWLNGYYVGMRNNSVIDTAVVQKQAQDLVLHGPFRSTCYGRRKKRVQRRQMTMLQVVGGESS